MHLGIKQINYLSHEYIEAVYRFEQLIQLISKDPFEIADYSVYQGSKQGLQKRRFEQLIQGVNENAIIQFYTFRIVEHNQCTYLLVSESNHLTDVSRYCLLVVLCTPKIFPKWIKEIGHSIKLSVKEIYVEGKLNNQMIICIARVENIILQTSKRKPLDTQKIRSESKSLFYKKQFYEAFTLYEIALSNHLKLSQSNLRAVLYANSSACLFEMRAYGSSAKYADIAMMLDKQYEKGYAKKIFALLQTKQFQEIPSLLVRLQMKIHASQFQKIYKKYTVYLANRIGQFKWQQFFNHNQNTRNQCVFGEYQSRKIEKKQIDDKIVFVAKQNIEPYELMMVKKPIMFKKYSDITPDYSLFEEFSKYSILEKSFIIAIDNLLFEKKTDYLEQINSNAFSNLKMFYRQRKVDDNIYEGKGIGVWPDILYCHQNCQPNCSFLTTRNALFISSVKNIQAGTHLTLDYACMEPPTQRKQFLKKIYGIECRCRICQWEEWPKNLDDIEQVAGLIEKIKNLKMLKQLIWTAQERHSLFLDETIFKKYDLDILKKFLTILETEPHWEDVLNLIILRRKKKNEHIKQVLELSITESLSKFLKIPPERCRSLIDKFL